MATFRRSGAAHSVVGGDRPLNRPSFGDPPTDGMGCAPERELTLLDGKLRLTRSRLDTKSRNRLQLPVNILLGLSGTANRQADRNSPRQLLTR